MINDVIQSLYFLFGYDFNDIFLMSIEIFEYDNISLIFPFHLKLAMIITDISDIIINTIV